MSDESAVQSWKDKLAGKLMGALEEEVDAFETNITLRKAGKLDAKIFAESRLRRGAYGQRYDNGQRHDGVATQQLAYPCGDLVKGPETVWDAPGMMRIKVPMGAATNEQLEMIADLAEEYSDSILHVTTRQDIQLHFVHIDDTPDLMRRLAAVVRAHVRDGDIAGRIGGEEFAVLLCESDARAAEAFAERLRLAVAATGFSPGGTPRQVTVSIGIATVSASRATRASLMAAADAALYQAKADGRNRTCVAA